MHINSSIPNLIGGVSQQPELIRLPSHLRAQVNGYSSPASGLSKRNPTIHLGTIPSFTGTGYHATLDYGTRGVIHLEIQPNTGVLRAVSDQGVPLNLYNDAGNPLGALPYLVHADPAKVMRVVKEADTTFLLNTDKVVGTITEPAALSTHQALVWVRAGNYGRTYSVVVPAIGHTASVTTPDGSTSSHINSTRTDSIAESLRVSLAGAGVSVVRNGSVLTLSGSNLTGLSVSDGDGGNSLLLVYKSIRSITELPSHGSTDGFAVKVEGGDATEAGDYFLRYNAEQRIYLEVRSPWTEHKGPDPATLPLVMIPYSDGYKVKQAAWGKRLVGDSGTSGDPEFLGAKINDLFFHQDRLGLISGENFDLSEQGSYYNFYRTTVRDLLDTDPISGAVTHPNVSTLRHAVPFNKRLLFFADSAQFEITSDGALTPKSVATRALTEFQCSARVRPLSMGASLYFPADRGDYGAFYNFFVAGIDSLEDAADISGHVPRYIPKGATHMAASPVNNICLAFTPVTPNKLYVYQFYQDGNERLQSAWHEWDLGAEAKVLNLAVIGSYASLVLDRGGVIFSEALDLSMAPSGLRMDQAFTVAPEGLTTSDDNGALWSRFTFPYTPSFGVFHAVVTTGTAAHPAGTVAQVEIEPGGIGRLRGNFTGCTLRVGRQYRFAGTLGQFMVREDAGGASAGVSRGRTQVARAWVNYTGSGPFSVEVGGTGKDTRSYRSTGRLLGTFSAVVGEASFGDGRFPFPVLGQNTQTEVTLVNDTPFPSSFLSVDWEGYHVARGQHV